MRALFGLDPDRARAGGINAAHEFEEALGFWARDYLLPDPARARHAVAADGGARAGAWTR